MIPSLFHRKWLFNQTSILNWLFWGSRYKYLISDINIFIIYTLSCYSSKKPTLYHHDEVIEFTNPYKKLETEKFIAIQDSQSYWRFTCFGPVW